MKLLAIDTSTDYLSVAVMSGGKAIARIHRSSPRSHSSLLMPAIDSALKKARLKLKDIAGFCISIGPGSFTGLRIGVATVKGMAYALNKPVVTVPTLDVIAENGKDRLSIICPVLDARKNKVYACLYRSGPTGVKRISGYLLLPIKDLLKKTEKYDNVFYMGDAAWQVARFFPGAEIDTQKWYPKPEVVGRLGAGYFKNKKFVSVEDLEPLYLYSRECDITGV